MAKLTGQTIAASYDQLLIVDHADGISSSLQAVESADTGGSASALQISTVAAAIDNPTTSSATQGGKLTLFSDDGAALGDTHRLGVLEFSAAEDSSSTITIGARIEAIADAAWSASENGADMVFYTTDGNASESEVLRLTADNLVGIGISEPTNPVEIAIGASDESLKLSCFSTTAGHAPALMLVKSDHASIGTLGATNAGETLGAISANGVNSSGNLKSAAIIKFQGDAGPDADSVPGRILFMTSDLDDVGSPTERMRIDDAGQVGINTTGPAALLDVSTASNAEKTATAIVRTTADANPAYANLQFHSGAGVLNQISGKQMSSQAHGSLFFYGRNGDSAALEEVMQMQYDGMVGIGDGIVVSAHLDVEDSSITGVTNTDYFGITSTHTITGGNFDINDQFSGIRNLTTFNHNGSLVGNFHGMINNTTATETSDGESGEMIGFGNTTQVGAGGAVDFGNIWGIYNLVDWNGASGTVVDVNLYGQQTTCDIESGGTISGYVLGTQIVIDSDTNPGGQVHALNLNLDTNGDYFIVAYDDVENSDRFTVSMNGTVTSEGAGNHSTGMDYAEYFESKDGSVIPIGTTVKLDDGKIVSCEEGDTPIGVVRPVNSSATIGGGQVFHWKDQFERDDYGEKIYEDYTLTKWIVEVDQAEYVERKGLDTGYKDMQNLYSQVEGSKAIPAKDAVIQQKTVDEEVEEEVTTTELVDGKYVQKTETVTKTVKVPQYDEEDLYDEDGEVIGKHQVPIMETVEEAVAAVDAVAATYFREHKYHSDRIPDGLTVPDDAEIITPAKQRQKLNPDYDPDREYESREERDEWHIVGLLGQIPTTKGRPVADNWIKMKDVSDTVEMYFVK